MRVMTWDELRDISSFRKTKTAVSIGVFDGMHRGHRKLIKRTVHNGAGLFPVVVTFRRNPRAVLETSGVKKDILTESQKIEILDSLGVKLAVTIDFSYNFSKINAKTFFDTLAASFQIKKIVVGRNFRFGKGREGDSKALKKMSAGIGAYCEIVEAVRYKGLRVSSTRIRHAIQEGNVADVRMMLSGDYRVVIPAHAAMEKPDNRTVIRRDSLIQLLPACGVYNGRCETGVGIYDEKVVVTDDGIEMRAGAASVRAVSFHGKIAGRASVSGDRI